MTSTLRVELFPADLDRAIEFYRRLGFEVRGRKDDPPYAALRCGDVRLGLLQAAPVDPGRRHVPAGAELVVDVDDIRRVRDELLAAGVDLAEDLTERPWGMVDVRLHDPDGYYWRFTSR